MIDFNELNSLAEFGSANCLEVLSLKSKGA